MGSSEEGDRAQSGQGVGGREAPKPCTNPRHHFGHRVSTKTPSLLAVLGQPLYPSLGQPTWGGPTLGGQGVLGVPPWEQRGRVARAPPQVLHPAARAASTRGQCCPAARRALWQVRLRTRVGLGYRMSFIPALRITYRTPSVISIPDKQRMTFFSTRLF